MQRLYKLLKLGSDSEFSKQITRQPEFCCKVNSIIEEYLETHSLTSIPFVDTCADLPAANLHVDELWGVLQDTGSKWVPTWLGGSFCPHGLYRSDGVDWVYLGVFNLQASQAEVDAGVNIERFVNPSTFQGAARWATKNSAILFEDEGVALGTTGTVDEIDFTGAGVTATRVLNKITVNVTGGGGSSGYTVNNINTSPYTETATAGEVFNLVDASGGVIIHNLPTAVGNNSKITVTKTDSSSNTVDITPNGIETIKGDSLIQILFQGTSIELMSDGANWFIT